MRLLWAELRDFRNHVSTRIDGPPDGLLVAVGDNGQGKTNLLEGVAYLFLLASPRTSSSQPLVRAGSEHAYVRGEVETLGGRVLIEVEIPTSGANRVQVNRSPVRRRRDVQQKVRAVFFGPDDLDVVRGDPSRRRAFMDEALTALGPVRSSLVTAYDRALRQRNRLLKDWEGRGAPPGLDAWDEELVTAGAALGRARADAVARLRGPASDEYQHLAGYGLEIDYAPNVDPTGDVEETFRQRLAERRGDELQRRSSLVGPHRDDLALAVRDLGVRAFASHGEAWAAALCLRIGLASAVADEIGEHPLLLLDDPFSALDPARQRRISERLDGRGQVFVSVADDAAVPDIAACIWDVRGGTITQRPLTTGTR